MILYGKEIHDRDSSFPEYTVPDDARWDAGSG